MKQTIKITAILVLSLSWIFALIPETVSSAYSKYKNSANYEYIRSTLDKCDMYFSKKSVQVDEYNPPYYQITGTFIWVKRELDEITGTEEYTVKYDFDRKEAAMYINGTWRQIDITSYPDSMATRTNKAIVNSMFRAAYGITFW